MGVRYSVYSGMKLSKFWNGSSGMGTGKYWNTQLATLHLSDTQPSSVRVHPFHKPVAMVQLGFRLAWVCTATLHTS